MRERHARAPCFPAIPPGLSSSKPGALELDSQTGVVITPASGRAPVIVAHSGEGHIVPRRQGDDAGDGDAVSGVLSRIFDGAAERRKPEILDD